MPNKDDVFDPESVDRPEGTSDEDHDDNVKQAHRDFEASKLDPDARALHDAARALVARGFTTEDDETFEHPDGGLVTIVHPDGE